MGSSGVFSKHWYLTGGFKAASGQQARIICEIQSRKLDGDGTGCEPLRGNFHIRGLLEKYPTFGREKETGLLGALDT